MNETEYLLRLEQSLYRLNRQERREAVEFVRELFEEARQEGSGDRQVIDRLGSPETYAAHLYENLDPVSSEPPEIPAEASSAGSLNCTARNNRQGLTWWKWILLIFAAPFALAVCAGVICLLAGLVCLLAGVLILAGALLMTLAILVPVLAFSGICLLFKLGMLAAFGDWAGVLFDFGAALLAFGLTWFLFLLVTWLWKSVYLKSIIRIRQKWQGLMQRKKRKVRLA